MSCVEKNRKINSRGGMIIRDSTVQMFLKINGSLSQCPWNCKFNSLFTVKICSRKEITRYKEYCFSEEVSNRKKRFVLIGRWIINKIYWKLDKKLPTESTLLKLKRSREKLFYIYFLNSESFEVLNFFSYQVFFIHIHIW